MKKDILLKETLKTVVKIVGIYVFTFAVLYIFGLIILINTRIDNIFILNKTLGTGLPFIMTLLLTIYVFYKYFGSTFDYVIKRGYTRKEFIIYSLLLLLIISIIFNIPNIIYKLFMNELSVGENNLIIYSTLYTVKCFIVIALSTTLVAKYNNWIIPFIVFLSGFAINVLISFKNFLIGIKDLISVIIGAKEVSKLEDLAVSTNFNISEGLIKYTAVVILIYLIWFVLTNVFRNVRD